MTKISQKNTPVNVRAFFKNCDLSLLKVTGIVFIDCHFENCKMVGIIWDTVKNLSDPKSIDVLRFFFLRFFGKCQAQYIYIF